jgi:hypothetical protein
MNEVPPTNIGASTTRKFFPWTSMVTAAFLCALVLFLGYFLSIPLQIVRDADAGFRKAKKTIQPEQLRSWALESIRSYTGTNGYSQEIPISEIPPSIKTLYSIASEKAWATPKSADSEAFVLIYWGGGFFHWGFYIGSTNFTVSTNLEMDHQIAEWVPGIYYMHEGKRKIR